MRIGAQLYFAQLKGNTFKSAAKVFVAGVLESYGLRPTKGKLLFPREFY